MEYKESQFNYRVLIEGKEYIFNTYSGACILGRIKKNEELSDKNIFVEKNIDEVKKLFHLKNKSTYTNREQSFFIAPTLNCNFNCSYCYALKDKHRMSKDVQDKVKYFLESSSYKSNKINITWIGGEPLLCDDIVCAINGYISEKIDNLDSVLVTNGYLLDNNKINKLVLSGIKRVIVSIDGSKSYHDNRRCLCDGNGTYEKIISNILKVKEKIPVDIRMNIDENNYTEIDSLISNLRFILGEETTIILAKVQKFNARNDYTENLNDSFEVTKGIFNNLNPKKKVIWGDAEPYFNCCNGANVNNYSIDSYGNLYACPIQIGDLSCKIGSLENLIPTRFFYEWYDNNFMLRKNECNKCEFLPLCISECKHLKLNGNLKSCEELKRYYDELVKAYVKGFI